MVRKFLGDRSFHVEQMCGGRIVGNCFSRLFHVKQFGRRRSSKIPRSTWNIAVNGAFSEPVDNGFSDFLFRQNTTNFSTFEAVRTLCNSKSDASSQT